MLRRRMAGLFFTGALAAAGLSAGIGGAAQAATVSPAIAANAVTPAPFTSYEIFPSFINPTSPKCVDVPGASRSNGAVLQLFHCKSSTNQLWQFSNQGTSSNGNVIYQIQNRNSGLCLEIGTSAGADGTLVTQGDCNATPNEEWQISSPIVANEMVLINNQFTSECMAAANTSGADHTPLVIQTCNPGTIFAQNRMQTMQLG